MLLIDFIKMYLPFGKRVSIEFEWLWADKEIDDDELSFLLEDEEYSFEGIPEEFIEKYTHDYDCLDDIMVEDLRYLCVVKGPKVKIYMTIERPYVG